MAPTFCDKFPWLFQYSFSFSSIFFSVLFNKFTKYKNLFNKYTSTKNQGKNKNKNWLKFLTFPAFGVKLPHFSSIQGKIHLIFQSVQNPLPFPWLENVFLFSRFSSPCGNHACTKASTMSPLTTKSLNLAVHKPQWMRNIFEKHSEF